ncbi:MAG: hypothetical protein ED557_05750 [Balneola sp.]|nr:MAG: hypothetical protein ED557_05750 [Balneola sp.]
MPFLIKYLYISIASIDIYGYDDCGQVKKRKIMKYLFRLSLIYILIQVFLLPNNEIEARESCHDNGVCTTICGEEGTKACSYAWCDDEIGTELCMSGGGTPMECTSGCF